MKILFITQHLDEDSDVLGITAPWLRALAQRVTTVHALALSVGQVSLPGNVAVHSLGKERGAGKIGQFVRFQRTLAGLAGRHEVDAIFVHMVPQYAILAAPLARLSGIPIVLWYAHGSVSGRLRLAHRLVQRVVTASPESFRLPSKKVVVTGHGVDTSLFDQPPLPASTAGAPTSCRVIAVGRISRIKDHETLVRALALLRQRDSGVAWRVVIAGAPLYADDHVYLRELRDLARQLGVAEIVEFAGSIPNRALPPAYGAADVAVSTSRTGSVDKVVLEAMACRRPVVTCNEAFLPIFGGLGTALTFPAGDAGALADRLHALHERPRAEQAELGEALRAIVVRDHSLQRWADRIVAVFESLIGRPGRVPAPARAAHLQ
jgi:glycosyltransferase involved in cell wall biosynthesis